MNCWLPIRTTIGKTSAHSARASDLHIDPGGDTVSMVVESFPLLKRRRQFGDDRGCDEHGPRSFCYKRYVTDTLRRKLASKGRASL